MGFVTDNEHQNIARHLGKPTDVSLEIFLASEPQKAYNRTIPMAEEERGFKTR